MVTGTYDNTTVYGTVPLTPFECNDFISLRATVLALSKPSANIDEKVYQMFMADYRDAKRDLLAWLETRIPEHSGVVIGDPVL